MWEISNSLQLIGFLRAFILGVFFCLAYDILRAIRIVKRTSHLTVFLEDLGYFIIIFPITFCYFLALTNGELRAYIFIAIIVGFSVSRVTLSAIVIKIYVFVFKILIWLFSSIKRFLNAVFSRFNAFFSAFSGLLRKNYLKIAKCVKKLLKKR